MDKKQHITQAEWPIMQVLWERESATAAQIVEAVTSLRDVSMRTVKTLIRRLVARGAVTYTVDARDSRVYHYRAAVSKESCTGEKAHALLRAAGDAGDVLVRFLSDARLSRGEIEELEKLLQRKKDELE